MAGLAGAAGGERAFAAVGQRGDEGDGGGGGFDGLAAFAERLAGDADDEGGADAEAVQADQLLLGLRLAGCDNGERRPRSS